VSSALAAQPEPAPVAKVSHPRLTNTALLMGASTVLLLGPLAFGAVEPWSIFALEACAMLLLAVWAYRQWIGRELNVSGNPLYFPMAAFLALVLVQWVVGTTAYRHVTYSHLLLYAAYGMLAFVVTQTLRHSSQFGLMAKLFTAYGAVVALFAVLQGMAPNGKIYWIRALEQGGNIYGPYVNHNHYAGLMEMLAPFPLVLAATRFTSGKRKIAVAAIAALMAASIFLSGSRGGMAAFAAQMVVLSVLLLRKRDGSWKQPLMLGMFLTMVVGFLLWMGNNALTQRLISIHSEAREEINGGLRLSIDRDCLRMLIKRPLLGWGLGAFPIVYPEFRSFYTTFFVNQAHNDYLQLLVETGLTGFSIAVWSLVLVFRQAAGKLRNINNDWTENASGALTAAALLACVGILVHSFVDFNLQIPANAALFYVLCAIAASAPLQEPQRRRVLRRRSSRTEPRTEPTTEPRPETAAS
jgi:O-antigen ligase